MFTFAFALGARRPYLVLLVFMQRYGQITYCVWHHYCGKQKGVSLFTSISIQRYGLLVPTLLVCLQLHLLGATGAYLYLLVCLYRDTPFWQPIYSKFRMSAMLCVVIRHGISSFSPRILKYFQFRYLYKLYIKLIVIFCSFQLCNYPNCIPITSCQNQCVKTLVMSLFVHVFSV